MGIWDKTALREKLMPVAEQERFLRAYGEAARPVLEAVLDAKVQELAERYEKSWQGLGEYLKQASDQPVILVSRDEAATMLGISLSSVQRLEKRGELPEPQHFGARMVRHLLSDILAFAKARGIRVTPGKP